MARYTGSSNRISRRLGFSTLETGKELAKKPYAPGQHGNKKAKKLSNYGVQLQEKQKVRFMYGLSEKQFKATFERAGKMNGVHGHNLFKLLESRLDNLVYRLGFSTTRRGARQLVNHGHITVNGKKVDIPSYTCKPGDVIAVKDNAKDMSIIKSSLEALAKRVEFVTYDENKMAGTYVRYPERNELNADINESLIIEYYNR
ncbi:MAG TPA: 30S ribosomal protein S4 [Candidatus Faecisoma merdavium]|nr:30S ribosomal protein S4 [Candidatus Faecisoma merdavium]